ncbi:Aldolase-type TIM barrel [Penicillium expansum]|nr:Aldolase-type TIM barrel [Penicillium expansum]
MEAIKEAFAKCKATNRIALITYVTAGYPTVSETPGIMLSMQAGGADIIELGIPFTDHVTEGLTIQHANAKALENGVRISHILQMVKSARTQGLAVPVLLVGYYKPVREYSYGEEKLLRDCKAAGVDGLVIVDLAPEDAVQFRGLCRSKGLSYIPLVSPSTPDPHMEMICNLADSFISIVSRMGVSGSHEKPYGRMEYLADHVNACTGNSVPVAVGFGINTRQDIADFARFAEGIVIGSPIIYILGNAAPGTGAQRVKEYCLRVAGRTEDQIVITERRQQANQALSSTTVYLSYDGAGDTPEDKNKANKATNTHLGTFSGQYIPESLMEGLAELENGFESANADPTFWAEINSYATYANRPSSLHLAPRLTAHAGGARIWLKREDLNHTGSHKINNALGQIILARRLGKTSIIAETGAGQHGVATATLCAQFGMKCTVFMGSEDFDREPLTVLRMRILGAAVVPIDAPCSGEKGTVRDAVNEAFRVWAMELETTHFVIGSAFGPHPYPTIVRTFQAVIGNETRIQFGAMNYGRLPDAVVACVGGGSNAVGMFYPFLGDSSVAVVGVEAGGSRSMAGQHSASLDRESVGLLYGLRTYLSWDEDGENGKTHYVSAGLDYPGVGPELSSWKESGRATFVGANDTEVILAFSLLSQLEGVMPALESSHAVAGAVRVAKELGPGRDVVVCLSGRGDKDVETVAHIMSTLRVDDDV